ncbi:glycosyltransferase family 4 protein [Sediminicola sp. 1XM1-17]|uniref:glycosyltransferase family 4 protein n=1 Tax=Sediminicola sp. 1XM1-17 TaxID=3127702 RepID=UPI003076AA20
MKILKVSYSLTSGGAERLVVDLCNELILKHEVHLLTILDDEEGDNRFYKEFLSEKVKYHCANEKKGFSITKIYRLNKIINQIAPDIVHFHGAGIILYFIPIILLNRRFKYLETLHNAADRIYTRKNYSYILKPIIRMNLVQMITISDVNKLSLERQLNVTNSTLIYNGRSLPTCSAHFKDVKIEVDGYKNNENDMVFIHIGRCSPQKNQKMLISVFNNLQSRKINCILLIIGANFDSKLGIEIKQMANPNIHFLGIKPNVIDYMLCSNAFCLSSIYEGMPISLIEAFACETVAICTPTSGAKDLIQDGKTGFISDSFSENSYLQAVQRFINNKPIDKKLLKEIYSNVFSIEKCAQLHEELYMKIISC